MAYLEITDNGCGMDPVTISRIFDPFYTTKFTGRGLGMSVVHGIVRGHDGAVMVNSEPGQGTTITVYLPVSSSPSQSFPEKSDEPIDLNSEKHKTDNGPLSVLVVDDEPDVNGLICNILKKQGINTVSAFNGKQAVEMVNNHPDSFCLAIVDLTMPEMDGVETFRNLLQIRPNMRVIMASGYDADEIIKKFGAQSLPEHFLKKPFDYGSVTRLVDELISGLK